MRIPINMNAIPENMNISPKTGIRDAYLSGFSNLSSELYLLWICCWFESHTERK